MSKPNEIHRDPSRRLDLLLAAVTGLATVTLVGLSQLPVGASAGVAAVAEDRVAPGLRPDLPAPASTPAASPKPSGSYRLRCWQYGRLLFDEGPVSLSPEVRQGAKLVATDRHGGTLIVTESGWTTCQARPFPAPPSLALPR